MLSCRDTSTLVATGRLQELPAVRRLAVWLHLAMCRHCRAFWRQVRGLDRDAEAALSNLEREMPADLTERLSARIGARTDGASVTQPMAAPWRWAAMAAAVVLVAASTAGVWLVSGSKQRAWRGQLALVADDFDRTDLAPAFRSGEPESVQRWLADRLPFGAHVPEVPEARLVGARTTELDGRPAAIVRYETAAGRPVSLYLMSAGPADPVALEPAEFVGRRQRGHQVVAWQGAGLTHALVGDLPEVDLQHLAVYCLHASLR